MNAALLTATITPANATHLAAELQFEARRLLDIIAAQQTANVAALNAQLSAIR